MSVMGAVVGRLNLRRKVYVQDEIIAIKAVKKVGCLKQERLKRWDERG
jgi:hypothetical protein